MRVLVCGDRWWGRLPEGPDDPTFAQIQAATEERDLIDFALWGLDKQHSGMIEVISGMAKGADSWAAHWATEHDRPLHKFPADWNQYGRSAGPIRNRQMLTEGKPDIVVAFHNDLENSKGTKDMVNAAKKAGLPVFHIRRVI